MPVARASVASSVLPPRSAQDAGRTRLLARRRKGRAKFQPSLWDCIKMARPARSTSAAGGKCRRDVEHDVDFIALADARGGGEIALHEQERRVGKECRSRWSPYH